MHINKFTGTLDDKRPSLNMFRSNPHSEIVIEPEIFAEHAGCVIKAFVFGNPDAKDRILFIHGWSASGADFLELSAFLCALNRDVCCFCVDLPGAGSSDKPSDAPYNIPYFVDVVKTLVAAVQSYGTARHDVSITLVGHSLGGNICACYAASSEIAIDRLVLIAPAGWPGEIGAFMTWLSKNETMLNIVPAFITQESYVNGSRAMMAGSLPYCDAPCYYTGKALETPEGRKALENISRNALETEHVDELLGNIPVPVLLMWGKKDKVLPFSYFEKFMSRLPQGTHSLVVENGGHTIHLERPLKLAVYMAAFIADKKP